MSINHKEFHWKIYGQNNSQFHDFFRYFAKMVRCSLPSLPPLGESAPHLWGILHTPLSLQIHLSCYLLKRVQSSLSQLKLKEMKKYFSKTYSPPQKKTVYFVAVHLSTIFISNDCPVIYTDTIHKDILLLDSSTMLNKAHPLIETPCLVIIASNPSTYLQVARHWFAYVRPFVPHTGFFTRGQSHCARALVSVRLPVHGSRDSISTPLKNNNNHFETRMHSGRMRTVRCSGLYSSTPWVTYPRYPTQ